MFATYFQLGFEHILDIKAYDHILFVVALCAVYRLSQWKHILVLVTAFTIGHSLTLALSALKIVSIPAELIEFLIPLTIICTAIFNILKKEDTDRKIRFNYILAGFFGLIHGLGFSNYFRALMGKEENIIQFLLPFNIGVEVGQIIIVIITMLLTFLMVDLLKMRHREWTLVLSGAAAGVALMLMIG